MQSFSQPITFENPELYGINSSHVLLKGTISTNVDPLHSIDLSIKRTNNCKVVLSQTQYSKVKTMPFTNKNEGTISFYSYAGGKEVSTLKPGSNAFSLLDYFPYSGTMLSTINLPILSDNDELYLVIDSYSEFNNLACPDLKKQLIKADTEQLLSSLEYTKELSNVKIHIIIESKIHTDIIGFYPDFLSNFQGDIYNIETKQLMSLLIDKLFGKIIGGQYRAFNGLLSSPSYKIVDAYINGNHTITNRGSGLSITGNERSVIYLILENTDASSKQLLLNESIFGTTLFSTTISDLEPYEYGLELDKLLDIHRFYNSNNLAIMPENKQLLKDEFYRNRDFIDEIEFDDITNILIDNHSWICTEINNKIKHYITILRTRYTNIRKLFSIQSTHYNNPNIMSRLSSCGNDHIIEPVCQEEYYDYTRQLVRS